MRHDVLHFHRRFFDALGVPIFSLMDRKSDCLTRKGVRRNRGWPESAQRARIRAIMSESTRNARREFLKFLAASPYVAALGGVSAFLERSGFAQNGRPVSEIIANPAEALNVFDFEEAAHRKVNPGHWAYMASGADDDATLRANRDGFKHIELRPRRLRDATKVDMRVELV